MRGNPGLSVLGDGEGYSSSASGPGEDTTTMVSELSEWADTENGAVERVYSSKAAARRAGLLRRQTLLSDGTIRQAAEEKAVEDLLFRLLVAASMMFLIGAVVFAAIQWTLRTPAPTVAPPIEEAPRTERPSDVMGVPVRGALTPPD
jgi:hypothetical protein